MKWLRILQTVTVLPLVLVLASFSPSSSMRGIHLASKKGEVLTLYKDYYALVIGVGRYTNGWPDLPGAQKDSAEVAAALEEYGFTVKLVANPTSREVKKAITEMAFVTGREENRAMLFYFAGHGETLSLVDGTKLGYIIPSDCPLKDKDPLGFDDLAISMKEIEALALKVQCKHVLMVFDSCFSGSLFSLVRAAPVEISEKSARPVRQFITAGGEGEQVPDRSVFKQVFLDGIKSDADLNNDGYVTASELGMYLQTKVVNYSGGGQHPQYGKINNPRLDKGDFIFVPKATRQKEEMETAKADAERAQVSEELKKLQEERRKNEELLERLKQLLETKIKNEESQKAGLEEKLKLAEKERQTSKADTDEKIRRMEIEAKAVDERLVREAAERRTLEEELQKLRTASEKTPQVVQQKAPKAEDEVEVAAIPREVSEPKLQSSAQEPNLKIAVFPMYISGPERARKGLLKGIHIAIDRSDMFREVFSSYQVEDRPDIRLLDDALKKKDLWRRKSFFSAPEPNLDLVCEEAKRLGIDAVLALFADVERTQANATAYVIDASKKKAYSAGAVLLPGQLNVTVEMINGVLNDYRKGR